MSKNQSYIIRTKEIQYYLEKVTVDEAKVNLWMENKLRVKVIEWIRKYSYAIVDPRPFLKFFVEKDIYRSNGNVRQKFEGQFPRSVQVQMFKWFGNKKPNQGELNDHWAKLNANEKFQFSYRQYNFVLNASIVPYYENIESGERILLVGKRKRYHFFGGEVSGSDGQPLDTAIREFDEETFGTYSVEELQEIRANNNGVTFWHPRSRTVTYFIRVPEKTIEELNASLQNNSTLSDIDYWSGRKKYWKETEGFELLKFSELESKKENFEKNYIDTLQEVINYLKKRKKRT